MSVYPALCLVAFALDVLLTAPSQVTQNLLAFGDGGSAYCLVHALGCVSLWLLVSNLVYHLVDTGEGLLSLAVTVSPGGAVAALGALGSTTNLDVSVLAVNLQGAGLMVSLALLLVAVLLPLREVFG